MTAYADNFTARVRLKYRTLGKVHTMKFRFDGGVGGVGVDEVKDSVTDFLTAIQPQLYADWTIINMDVASEGSDIYLPTVAPTITPGAITTPSPTSGYAPVYITFVGRSQFGGPGRLFVFGYQADPVATTTSSADYRWTAAENTVAGAGIAVLNASGIFRGADAGLVSWYPYVNVGVNAYYQRKARNA